MYPTGPSLPEESDTFSEEDADDPGLRNYFFWTGRDDCSLQQKTLVKSLYGAHSPHLVQTMPPIHVHVVLRQRNTGKMVTIISQSRPSQIVGEDYGNKVGHHAIWQLSSPLLLIFLLSTTGPLRLTGFISFAHVLSAKILRQSPIVPATPRKDLMPSRQIILNLDFTFNLSMSILVTALRNAFSLP